MSISTTSKIKANIREGLAAWLGVWTRYPIAMAGAVLAAGIWLRLLRSSGDDMLERALMVALLATAWGAVYHVREQQRGRSWLGLGVLLVGLLGFGLWSGVGVGVDFALVHRFAVLLLVGLLALSLAPFGQEYRDRGFVTWSATLLSRLLEAMAVSLILFLGLVLAHLALHELFGISLLQHRYWLADLFAGIAALVTLPYFLSGLGHKADTDQPTYFPSPRAWKIVTSYILTPIIVVYGAILYAYLIKLLLQNVEIVHWVTYFQAVFVLLGTLIYCLHRYVDRVEPNTVTTYYLKSFFVVALPLIVFMLHSIYQRIGAEGVAVSSYIEGLSAISILILALYFLISKKDDLRIVPLVYMEAALVSILGPLSIRSVVLKSQSARLIEGMQSLGYADGEGFFVDHQGSPEPNAKISQAYQALQGIEAFDELGSYDRDGLLAGSDFSEAFYSKYIGQPPMRQVDHLLSLDNPPKAVIDLQNYDQLIPTVNAHINPKPAKYLSFDGAKGFTYVDGRDTARLGQTAQLDKLPACLRLQVPDGQLDIYLHYLQYEELAGDSIQVHFMDAYATLLRLDNQKNTSSK